MTTRSTCRSTDRPNVSALLIPLRTAGFREPRSARELACLHENRRGMFKVVADRLDERRAHMAVDHAMVERARHVHHLADRNLVVPDDRTLLDLVDAQDGDIGPVADRRCEDAPFLAERRDREGGALDVLEGEFLVPRGRSQPLDFFREVPEALLVGLVDDRDREAFVRGGRDSDVVVSLYHDLSSLVVDGGVQVWELHERREDRFYGKGEERELDSLAVRGRVEGVAQGGGPAPGRPPAR